MGARHVKAEGVAVASTPTERSIAVESVAPDALNVIAARTITIDAEAQAIGPVQKLVSGPAPVDSARARLRHHVVLLRDAFVTFLRDTALAILRIGECAHGSKRSDSTDQKLRRLLNVHGKLLSQMTVLVRRRYWRVVLSRQVP
jgi:hypothetical protein